KKYMRKMGISIMKDEEFSYPAQSLGSSDTLIEENTNAFTTFGNNGKFNDAFMIEKITTNSGEVIYEHEQEEVEVFSPQTTYLTIDMRRDVIPQGTATSQPNYVNNTSVDWAVKPETPQNQRMHGLLVQIPMLPSELG